MAIRQAKIQLGLTIIILGSILFANDIISKKNIKECKQKFAANSEVISFNSGKFSLKGIFVKPNTPGPYPVIIFNHGDSSARIKRTSNGVYWIIWRKFLEIGYACLSWDTPGGGESTGEHNWDDLFNERTSIVLSAIDYLKSRDDVNISRIGLFGHSQAGYIMPMVISKSKDVAFMINMSGPAMTSIEQGAYQVEQKLKLHGLPDKEAKKYGEYYRKRGSAKTYKKYLKYAKLLNQQPYVRDELKRGDITTEDKFKPGVRGFQWNYAPYTLLKNITIPVLAVFGGKDNLINAKKDAKLYIKALKKAKNNHYTVKVFPNADHSLGQKKDGEYMFVPGVFDFILDWLSRLK